jgi:prepilin-type N-terminal cleavage/methylation domain-containing protein
MNAIVARSKRDDGFTLVELLVGMLILSILIGAIAEALIVGFKTTSDTSQRFAESHDAQIASAYLARDVQGSLAITNATTPSCGGGALISFSLDGGKQISYYYGPSSSGETQVTRRLCDGSGAQILAHFADAGTPDVKCDGAPCNPAAQPKPDVVKISITEASGYAFTLLGSRRIWNTGGSGGGGTSAPPLTLLAFGNSPLQIKGGCKKKEIDPTDPDFIPECAGEVFDPHTQGDTAKLTVNGNLYVNAAVNGAVKFTGKGKLAVPAGEFKILQGGTCQRCSPGNTYPYPPGSYPLPYPDPLAFMTYPTGTTPRTCSGGECYPGVYNTLNLNTSAHLNPGIYILKHGMQVNGSATVTGSGVMLFNDSGTGSITFNGGSSINLTPYDADPYKGILIFQHRANTSDLRLSGGTTLNPASFVGIIYAKNALNVYLGSGGATMHVTAVIAQNIVVTGNSAVTIG